MARSLSMIGLLLVAAIACIFVLINQLLKGHILGKAELIGLYRQS